jgi:hypothetical protein
VHIDDQRVRRVRQTAEHARQCSDTQQSTR